MLHQPYLLYPANTLSPPENITRSRVPERGYRKSSHGNPFAISQAKYLPCGRTVKSWLHWSVEKGRVCFRFRRPIAACRASGKPRGVPLALRSRAVADGSAWTGARAASNHRRQHPARSIRSARCCVCRGYVEIRQRLP